LVSINLVTSGSSSSINSVSGLEISSRGLSLIQGCSEGQVLAWDSINGWWECSAKTGGGAVAIDGSPSDNQLAVWSGGGTSITDSNLWFVSEMLGVGTSDPSYTLEVSGSIMALDYFTGLGTLGASTVVSGLTFEDGLFVSGEISGFLTEETYLGTVTSITAGSGMDFSQITSSGSITLGTPGTLSSTSTNLLSGTSHTHAITNYALNGTAGEITLSGESKVLGAQGTLSLATTGVVSGTYGSSTLIPIIQVDSKGRILVAGSVSGGFLTSYNETDPIWSASEPSYFKLSDNETVLGIPAFNGGETGVSAPFTVDSTYLVSNLNADLLDGQEGSYYLDNTDAQTLGTSGNAITLLNGGSVISPYAISSGSAVYSTLSGSAVTADLLDGYDYNNLPYVTSITAGSGMDFSEITS
jgi:hypothetical protein